MRDLGLAESKPMGRSILYLVRHGESVANFKGIMASRKIDPPLTNTGIEQANQLANLLAPLRLRVIYSSPWLRARQTAKILSLRYGAQVIFHSGLAEIDLGILDGKKKACQEKWMQHEEVKKKWEQGVLGVGFPEGETLSDVRRRLECLFDALATKQERRILIVGHCLLFIAIIWLFCENHGPTFDDGHMNPGHISILAKTARKLRLLRFNIPPNGSPKQILIG